jgi:hypothetical protein
VQVIGTVLEEVGRPGRSPHLVRIEAAGLGHFDVPVVDGNRPRPVGASPTTPAPC